MSNIWPYREVMWLNKFVFSLIFFLSFFWRVHTTVLKKTSCNLRSIWHTDPVVLIGWVMYQIPALCRNFDWWRYKSIWREWVLVLGQSLYFFSVAYILLNSFRYEENAKFQSKLFKDRPLGPMETAIYWTEYVMRYGGASHLKSAAMELYWFQYIGLDIALVYLMAIISLVYLIYKCAQLCYRVCTPKSTKESKKTQ